HTRFSRDWSSDVCSSDLDDAETDHHHHYQKMEAGSKDHSYHQATDCSGQAEYAFCAKRPIELTHYTHQIKFTKTPGFSCLSCLRSEERRVGKECRSM